MSNDRKKTFYIAQINDTAMNDDEQTQEKELERIKNIAHVNVTSAIELADERKEQIKAKIAEKLSKDVIVEWGVDSDIIAGLIFNIDELIIDNSIRHKLDNLSKEIIKG